MIAISGIHTAQVATNVELPCLIPGMPVTPTTNFGTYANQTLDNRILQVSGKIVF